MRLLGFDTETSGLDPRRHRVIEYGWALWDTDTCSVLSAGGVMVRPANGEHLPAEITRVTGITDAMLQEFGIEPVDALEWLAMFYSEHAVDRIVAQNAPFDRSFLAAELDRLVAFPQGQVLRDAKWIDTHFDLPPRAHVTQGGTLTLVAAQHGFLNPFPHRAMFDAATCVRLLHGYDIAEVLARADSPEVLVHAVCPFDARMEAKDLRFWWCGDTKRWLKKIKHLDWDGLVAQYEAQCVARQRDEPGWKSKMQMRVVAK